MESENNKKALLDTVKNWVILDNQIRLLNKKLKELKDNKKIQNENMIEIMKSNEIDNFDLKDGQIRYKKTKKRQVLSQKVLVEILKNHPQFDNESVNQINNFVYQNRKVIEEDKIIRVIHE